ncbi:hypothetical protein SLS58_006559 [Diplodia intermedia]|uniref:Uncharacterized protein n=1 Tax=Diplodia intermedia TaxID=856260 RepID=A0ABR3TMY6_9PEZI
MTSFSGQTKKETIQKEYGWTQHQWERFLDEAKELFYTHKYWKNTEKPDDVTWDDLEGDVIEWFIEEVNKRLVKCRIQVDYKLIKWRLLPLLRRKPSTFKFMHSRCITIR